MPGGRSKWGAVHNGQVERMNRTLKEATVRRYHYATDQQLQEHLAAFLDAYNFAKRLKSLNGLTLTKPSPRLGPPNQVASYETQPSSIRD